MATKLASLLLALSLVLQATLAVKFTATNNASATPGGQRFDREIGTAYTLQTMPQIADFIWKIFGQKTPAERRHYNPDVVNLYVDEPLRDGALGEVRGNNILMSGIGIAGYPTGMAKRMFTSILYHEMTHIFQWSGEGTAPGGLTEGIADYVVMKSEFYNEGYSTPGEGSQWDEGYGTTARFLEYCDSLREGFTPELNKMMRKVYKDDYFNELLGKSVDQLWREYKAKYSHVKASME